MNVLEEKIRQAKAKRRLPAPPMRRYLRERAGISQQVVADEVGVSRVEVCRWESGQRSPRPGQTLEKYLQVLSRLATEGAE